jgi:hypothetical protein
MPGTKLTGIAAVGVGALFVYAGIKGFSILKATQNVIRGTGPEKAQTTNLLAAPGNSGQIPTATGIGTANPATGMWTHGGLANLWIMNGGAASAANNAACHALQESSGNASVTSSNPDGGINVGLWQLDTKGVGAGYTVNQLKDPNLNARLAIRGSHNGSDWGPWATPGC